MDASNMEDLRLPNTVVTRLIKEAIPDGVNVSKEARTAIARSAAIFVVHATTYANDYAVAQERKNVTATDVFHAIKELECSELEEPMAEAMQFYKAQNEQRRKRKSAAAAARRSNGRTADTTTDAVEENNVAEDSGDARNAPSSDDDGENDAPDQPADISTAFYF